VIHDPYDLGFRSMINRDKGSVEEAAWRLDWMIKKLEQAGRDGGFTPDDVFWLVDNWTGVTYHVFGTGHVGSVRHMWTHRGTPHAQNQKYRVVLLHRLKAFSQASLHDGEARKELYHAAESAMFDFYYEYWNLLEKRDPKTAAKFHTKIASWASVPHVW
jgi:hypothetical protein